MSKHLAPPPAKRVSSAAVATTVLVAVLGLVITAVAVFRPSGNDVPDAAADISLSKQTPSHTPSRAGVNRPKVRVLPTVEPQPVREAHKALRPKPKRVVIGPTTFRVGTLNVLGASHTEANGKHQAFASGVTRMGWVVSLLGSAGLDVVGFQELQPPQYNVLHARAPVWASYPPAGSNQMSLADSIAWRSDVWELVEGHTLGIPYFGGETVAIPYVLLENIETGQRVWFLNTHNPADAHGPAQGWRNAAVARQIALTNQLTADGTPLVMTGDMNDREEFFCPVTAQTNLGAANGGSTGSSCAPPARMDVDWVMGSAPMTFSGFVSSDSGLVARATDHPFVYAEATIPRTSVLAKSLKR